MVLFIYISVNSFFCDYEVQWIGISQYKWVPRATVHEVSLFESNCYST